jgi:exopolysaccharide production protein ExoQ
MTPLLGTAFYVLVILALFYLNRDRKMRTDAALWIPVIWLSICGSRMVSQWVPETGSADAPDTVDAAARYLDGSPLDRALLSTILILGLIVLFRRRQKVWTVLRKNPPIVVFLLYCGISVFWSNFPDVSFKRWVKAVGDLTMVLVVLTDRDPSAAVKRLLTRVGFVLVPLSVLLIKYYPELGRGYNPYTWMPYFKGVTLGKNELGIVCLIVGLACLWRILPMLKERAWKRDLRLLLAQGMCLGLVIWLFREAHSMTSLACFLMAGALLVVASMRWVARRQWMIHALVLSMLALSFATLFLDVGAELVKSLGKDPTLTGRTEIWSLVLGMTGNPLLGTGFESFWLGPRLEKIWKVYWWHPNEAHNGYIEVFLNLGWMGVLLLLPLLVAGYRNVMQALRRYPEEGRLRLAFFLVAVAYNLTESAFRIMHPIWIVFLLAIVSVPGGWARIKKVKTAKPVEVNAPMTPRLEEV